MARRFYSSIAVRTTLSSGINSSVTSITVAAVTGFPGSYPYTLILDEGLSTQEVVEVTAGTGTTLTITRGVDGSTAVAHSTGAAVNHGVSARDFNEPNQFLNEGGTVTGASAITANTTTPALQITQTGTGNALVVEDSTSPDSTPFVVDAAGNVGIAGLVNVGDTTAVTGQTVLSALLSTDTAAGNNMALRKCNSGPNSANFLFAKGRGSAASPSVVQGNDTIGNFIFSGFDGTNYVNAAYVQGAVDGTPGTNDMPGRLVFWTTPDGSANPQERMRITQAGNVGIGTTTPGYALDVNGTVNASAVFVNGAPVSAGGGAGLQDVFFLMGA